MSFTSTFMTKCDECGRGLNGFTEINGRKVCSWCLPKQNLDKMFPVVTHDACQARIAELEAEVARLKAPPMPKHPEAIEHCLREKGFDWTILDYIKKLASIDEALEQWRHHSQRCVALESALGEAEKALEPNASTANCKGPHGLSTGGVEFGCAACLAREALAAIKKQRGG